MSINIKNPETTRLIRELAELTGEGQTEAVTKAVKEQIERIRSEQGYGRAERIREIVDRMAPALQDMPDIDDFLYDPVTGLPK